MLKEEAPGAISVRYRGISPQISSDDSWPISCNIFFCLGGSATSPHLCASSAAS